MRLIDADDLKESMGKPKDKVEEMINKVICDYIDLAPTIEPDGEALKAGYIKGALKYSGDCSGCSGCPSAEWVIRDYSSEFGNFKRWACDRCDNWRAQVSVAYCAFCGAKMVNPEEVEESEGTILGGES